MTSRAEKRQLFLDALIATGKKEISLSEIRDLSDNIGIPLPQWFTNDETNKVKRGIYRIPKAAQTPSIQLSAQVIPMAKPETPTGHRISNVTTDLEI